MLDNDKIVKSNSLINARYQMELSEHRLMLVAIVKTRGTNKGFDKENPVEIAAKEYAEFFNIAPDNVYSMMKEAQDKLKRRTFDYSEVYKGKYTEHVSEPIFIRSSYVDSLGLIRLSFSPSIRPLISELEGKFTEYELMQIKELTSQYAIRLYELLIQWRTVGKVQEIPLDDFRLKLGVGKKDYERFYDLEKRVIDVAINQVKKHTDIKNIKMEKHKNGRVIRGISFTFTASFKKERDVISEIPLSQEKSKIILNDKQANLFASMIAKNVCDCIEGFGYLNNIVDSNQNEKLLAKKIENDFKNGDVDQYEKALILCGFIDHSYKKKAKSTEQEIGEKPLVSQDAPITKPKNTRTKKSTEKTSIKSIETPSISDVFITEEKRIEKNTYDIPSHVMERYIINGGTMTEAELIACAKEEKKPSVSFVMREIGVLIEKKKQNK